MNYDQNGVDSTLAIPTVSHFKITDSGSMGLDGIPRTEFGNQESITAFANVTDAVGVYDIKSAAIVVKNVTTNATVVSESMSIYSSGPVGAQSWDLFKGSFGPLAPGNYTINITAADNSGSIFWVNWAIRIAAIHHFKVVASTDKVEAGHEFIVTIEAMDSGNNRMRNWSGNVSIEANNSDTGIPIVGLSNTSIFISSANHGIINVSENFTKAPKNITIKATNGSTSGESQKIAVSPGPIWNLTVDPDTVTMPAGATIQLRANATDRFGNINTSWQPYWYLGSAANGTLVLSGMTVQLIAILAGQTNLTCQDNSSGKKFAVEVSITTSGLVSIVVTPISGAVWEGDSMSISATGYDNFGNPLSITGAVWSRKASPWR